MYSVFVVLRAELATTRSWKQGQTRENSTIKPDALTIKSSCRRPAVRIATVVQLRDVTRHWWAIAWRKAA
jgi:hypothetical protein